MARPKVHTDFRERCRQIVLSKPVWENIMRHCAKDAPFALDVATHGFGRPPQTLDVTQNITNLNITIVAQLHQLPPAMLAAFVERGEWKALPEAQNV